MTLVSLIESIPFVQPNIAEYARTLMSDVKNVQKPRDLRNKPLLLEALEKATSTLVKAGRMLKIPKLIKLDELAIAANRKVINAYMSSNKIKEKDFFAAVDTLTADYNILLKENLAY